MRIEDLKPADGSRKRKRRVGRGPGSGHGKTSGRGHKGQMARSNGKGPGFEGGQMPLIRRVPKRGFINIFREPYAVVNIGTLGDLSDVDTVTVDLLRERGLIRKSATRVKILGEGEIGRAVKVQVQAVSTSARAKIEAAGGTVDLG
jgi:large subunit ribosomal protein L15